MSLTPEREYDSPKERAAILGVSVQTIYRAIADGSIDAERIRGSWRLPRKNRIRSNIQRLPDESPGEAA
jgi:excisionase family DNA binding protein